jgi:hypothetical protein
MIHVQDSILFCHLSCFLDLFLVLSFQEATEEKNAALSRLEELQRSCTILSKLAKHIEKSGADPLEKYRARVQVLPTFSPQIIQSGFFKNRIVVNCTELKYVSLLVVIRWNSTVC